MTTDEDSGPKPEANSPVFLAGSRPSFLEIVSSHPSILEQGAEEKEPEQPKLEACPARGGSAFEIHYSIGAVSKVGDGRHFCFNFLYSLDRLVDPRIA
jgi:hypothetical protein